MGEESLCWCGFYLRRVEEYDMDNELEEIRMRLGVWCSCQGGEIDQELKAMGQNPEKFPIKFKIKGGIDIDSFSKDLGTWNNKLSSLENDLSEFERHKRHLLRFAFQLNKYAEASWNAEIFSQTIYYLDEAVFILNLAYKLRDNQASLDQAKSELAKFAVQSKLAADPKQIEKKFVYQCWQDWQKKPDSYNGKAAFARDMLAKYESLKSQPVIEGWCRDWEKANPAG